LKRQAATTLSAVARSSTAAAISCDDDIVPTVPTCRAYAVMHARANMVEDMMEMKER
jgi:predicted component of type VI protein secretion system